MTSLGNLNENFKLLTNKLFGTPDSKLKPAEELAQYLQVGFLISNSILLIYNFDYDHYLYSPWYSSPWAWDTY
jgi:hypothetical protein